MGKYVPSESIRWGEGFSVSGKILEEVTLRLGPRG